MKAVILGGESILFPITAAHLSLLIGALSYAMTPVEGDAADIGQEGRKQAGLMMPKVSAACFAFALAGLFWLPLRNVWVLLGLTFVQIMVLLWCLKRPSP